MNVWEMIGKLAASVVLGALIGLERETHGRPAGLRTHILVSVGSTLFTLCSYSIAGASFDPGRVTAQIVTGIGFLGAGTIIRQGNVVRGLTTAASVWTVAAIGVAVGIGGQMLYLAAAASVLVFLTLTLVGRAERLFLIKPDERLLLVTATSDQQSVCRVLAMLARSGVEVRLLGSEEGHVAGTQVLKLRLRVGRDFDQTALGAELAAAEDVISYSWE